ncbi:MAG TPA: hypothetical protein VF941_05755 [Clostridia bacterium]
MIVVKNEVNKIVGINCDAEFEATLIQSFVNDNQIIIFPWRSCNLANNLPEGRIDGPNWNEFVLERTVIKSREDVFNWGLDKEEYFLWFSPQNSDDLVRIIKFEWICYGCCIIPKDGDIKDYIYYLDMYEHDEYEGEEYRSLFINESRQGSFEKDILPNIQGLLNYQGKKKPYQHQGVIYFDE